METVEQQYLKLLNQKSAEVGKILELTQQAHFTGLKENIEDESERFASLYENREEIISRIQMIDDALSDEAFDDVADSEEPIYKQTIERIKSMAAAIVELDKKNMAVSEKLSGLLRGNLKQIREGRGTSDKYTSVYEESTSGFLFDKKQ